MNGNDNDEDDRRQTMMIDDGYAHELFFPSFPFDLLFWLFGSLELIRADEQTNRQASRQTN